MLRFAVTLLLTLTLLIGCRGDRSFPTTVDWKPESTLSVETVKTTPFVWWEAEAPTKTNFPPSDRNPFAPANPTEAVALSGEKWIGVEGKRPNRLFLEYQVKIPATGEYFFYTRKFWQHGAFRWHWDAQPWQEVGAQVYLMDDLPLRRFVTANWVGLGRVKLASGDHRLRVELTQQDGAAAFDCFVLTRSPLQPRGKLQPNQRFSAKISDGFLFEPANPVAASPIDLRDLNESFAGENGRIQVRGEEFIHAKSGKPERFWAVNVGAAGLLMDDDSMETTARFLAKQGVNLVRIHAPLWSEDLNTIDPTKRDCLFAFVAALKQQGIYTCLSIYFPVWLPMRESYGFPGYTGQHPFALLFFNSKLQQIYFGWWKSLLTTPNPYTGRSLRDDPAVAMVELINEDSYFFWTFKPYDSVPAPQMELLERQFGDWLIGRYGTIDAALAAWSSKSIRGDEPAAGRAGILPVYELSQQDSRRSQDTAAFLAHSQQKFFERAIAHLRQDLDYKGLIYASNWITANPQILGPLDKYTNTVADFMDRHGYFTGLHEGEAAEYSLNSGQTYQDRSALLFQSLEKGNDFDFDLPIMDVRYGGKPSTITEINWAMPNRFRADFPLLVAAYGCLQGTDGFFFFATESPSWQSALTKFAIASPVVMGQFPATALIYRKGLIRSGTGVVDVSLKTEDVFRLQGAPVTAPQNLDQFRAQDVPAGQTLQSDSAKSIDPLAFLVGKVDLRFAERVTAKQVELSQFIDREAKTVRSSTGELLWNYDRGLVTVNAPQAQGATGFLRNAGEIELGAISITSDMDYGTILLVALDNRPLTDSRRMLLQVMSEEQTFGWKTSGSSRRMIESVGNSAIAVRHLAGTVKLDRSDAATLSVTPLDHDGLPLSKLGNAATITLQPQTFYYLIQ